MPDSEMATGRGREFFRPDEAAIFLGVDRSTVDAALRLWRVSGGKRGLPHARIGNGYLIRRAGLEQWLQGCELETAHA